MRSIFSGTSAFEPDEVSACTGGTLGFAATGGCAGLVETGVVMTGVETGGGVAIAVDAADPFDT